MSYPASLTYEIYWEKLRPVGMFAQGALRVKKGYVSSVNIPDNMKGLSKGKHQT